MTDQQGYSGNPGDPSGERVSTAERDGALRALEAHRAAGRLDSIQFETRQQAAEQAQTWGQLVPLFADLPEPRPAKVTALSAYRSPGAPVSSGTVQRPTGPPRALPERTRETIMALTPFAALILFFTTHTWLWFLAIPVMGILLYGGQGRPPRGQR